MNKGFLRAYPTDIISDLTMLKEEPDDITAHLQASTGPTCIPLDDDDSSPLFDLNFMDSHNLILSDDINSLDSSNSQNSNKYYQIDPFINYRDESNDTSSSQHLLSPGAVSKSPDVASSLPSLCSPNSLSQDELAFMTSDENIDLSMRAPYISMDEQDDLPLLTADGNVMWNQYNENIPIIHHPEMKDGIIQSNNNNNHHQQQQAVTTTTTQSSVALTTSTTNSSNNPTTNDVNSLIENIMQLQNNHMVHTQQQHPQSPQGPQLLNGMPTHQGNDDIENIENIIINGGKFDSVPNLCDSMEAFENYHKDYSWRDFLQINPSDLATQDDKLQIPQQSIILNTAAVNPTTTTIHVPLITIQNNSNHKNLTTANLCNINGDIKLTTTPQKLTAAMIRISNNNANTSSRNLLLTTTATSPNNQISNKRHIITSRTPSMMEPKRIKNNSVEVQTSTQLLQQLMAPTQKQKVKAEWNNRNGEMQQQQQQQLPSNNSSTNSSASSSPAPSSNSVLKNLLVSGCDLPFPPQEPTSTTSSPATIIVSNYLNEDVFLVSPDSTYDGPDDMPPALIALNDNESTNDSGIDETHVLSHNESTLNIAKFDLMDNQPTSTREESEKRSFRKRRHSALMADDSKEKVMKNRGAEEPPTPPNVGSPFVVSDAFLMEYNLAGEEYLNGDIEKFLE